MRWPVKWLLALVLAGIATLAVIRFISASSSDVPPATPDKTSSIAALPRTGTDASRNARGREFPKRAYPRNRGGAPPALELDTNTPGMLKLSAILEADAEDVVKAKQLLTLAPALPDEEKMEAADHAANLITDGNYDVLRKVLTDPRMPEPVLSELLGDLLKRGNSLKLPVLVDIARQPDHPQTVEAHDLLELHLGEDYGSNWPAWLDAIKHHVDEHGE